MRALEKRAAVSDWEGTPMRVGVYACVSGWCVCAVQCSAAQLVGGCECARCEVQGARCKGQDRRQLWLVNHPALADAKWSNWGWKEGQALV